MISFKTRISNQGEKLTADNYDIEHTEEYIKIDADINNTGVVAIMPGEVVSFCSIIPAECIHEKIEPGDYRIIREVFIDEKLTKSAGYAEHIFNVQNSIE